MATIVFFHAHPDDESIATGGTMARAAAEGHRTVLVFATRGEVGEVDHGVLAADEPLARRREQESHRSAEILGAARVEFLGYRDSGMMGEDSNDAEGSFWRADPDVAAGALSAILTDVGADVLTIYDSHGGYGHPDHIQVHRVGVLAAERAAVGRVFEATMNRDHLARLTEYAGEFGIDTDTIPDLGTDPNFGSPESAITTAVDCSRYLEQKRMSMSAHASQIGPDHFMLAMPPAAFAMVMGTEWFIERGAPRPAEAPMRDRLLP
ncbi:MAG: PIG-L family deacetylase [Actinomycetia bacterium]|nr:PIG-L family deacetylase [Actinomycetes bacterium]MCH9733493.1 PIG-L family deacetylase [Actinomycetes bacterium]